MSFCFSHCWWYPNTHPSDRIILIWLFFCINVGKYSTSSSMVVMGIERPSLTLIPNIATRFMSRWIIYKIAQLYIPALAIYDTKIWRCGMILVFLKAGAICLWFLLCVLLTFFYCKFLLPSLKLTTKAPENWWLEDDHFLLGCHLFRCYLGHLSFKTPSNHFLTQPVAKL